MNSFAVMGSPIAHSLSPYIHRAFAQQTNISLSYRAIEVSAENFLLSLQEFAALNGVGVNLTHPLKEEGFKLCYEISERARAAGSVNTLKFSPNHRWYGDNTDGIGLVNDLEEHLKFSIAGKKILLLGAGGAARGVINPLLQAQPNQLALASRTFVKAKMIVDQYDFSENCLALDWRELDSASVFDLIINATSQFAGDDLILPSNIFNRQTLCYDLNYAHRSLGFMNMAKQFQAKYVTGLGMLVEQAAESFYVWHGIRPNVAPVLTILQNSDDLSSFVLE